MEAVNVKSVLKAWQLVEAIAPCEVPYKNEKVSSKYFMDNRYRARTRLVDLHEVPWVMDRLKDEKKYNLQYRYYMGCFPQYLLVRLIRNVFQNNEEIFNQDNTTLFSFSFALDSNGKYIKDSMFVPLLMYVLKEMNEGSNIHDGELANRFREQLQVFEEQAQTVFLNGVNKESLQSIRKMYARYFHQFDSIASNYIETEVKKAGNELAPRNFNSFYLDDLEQILQKGENKTIRRFIEGTDQRIDLNSNLKYVEEILQPKNLPEGRWPSPVGHRLSLMQQVAVNQIVRNDQPISSVNGPPGTGKTTLLKDVFAHLVVRRAAEMAKLDNPTKAFHVGEKIEIDGYIYPIYLLDDSLSAFSMVVASSNNGAVENISKELPQQDQIIRSPEDNKYKLYEEAYAKETEELSMYPSVAKELLGNDSDAWGLFSGALGKSNNISTFGWTLQGSKQDEQAFIAQLERDSKEVKHTDWEKAVKEFQDMYRSIQKKKDQLQHFSDEFERVKGLDSQLEALEKDIERMERDQSDATDEMEHLKQQERLTEQQIKSLPKQSFFQRLLGKKDKEMEALQAEFHGILSSIKEVSNKLYDEKKQKQVKEKKRKELSEALAIHREQHEYYKKQGLVLPEGNYWADTKEANEYRQLKTIWLTDELNFERGMLFLKAMQLHKLMLVFNVKAIKVTIRLLNNRRSLNVNDNEHRLLLHNMWKTLHLITPVVSTTFASFSGMYRGVDKDFIDYLFIDEAGQASPQQAAGALWRSKQAIVVGDPLQIEPVVTLDETILTDIRKHEQLPNLFIGATASVQTLADRANPYGMYTKNGQWVGTPLWVHRRCLDPMFTMANQIAYDDNMVLANKKDQGKSIWFDCKGTATNRQFVKEQGELVADHIIKLWEKSAGPPNVYIISPFTSVKDGIKKAIKSKLQAIQVSKEEINLWLKESVGTVHTFQGKEADIVYFVIGTDDQSDGAANWSCAKPNLINVAVTRAKKEFHVVGDYQRLANKEYYRTIIDQLTAVEKADPLLVD